MMKWTEAKIRQWSMWSMKLHHGAWPSQGVCMLCVLISWLGVLVDGVGELIFTWPAKVSHDERWVAMLS